MMPPSAAPAFPADPGAPAAGHWLPWAVVGFGIALRIALGFATPALISNDNHMPPMQIIAHEHRLPRPDECWSCYQPPLYYLFSAGIFAATERLGIDAQRR